MMATRLRIPPQFAAGLGVLVGGAKYLSTDKKNTSTGLETAESGQQFASYIKDKAHNPQTESSLQTPKAN